MMPTWLLTIWHVLSIAAAATVLLILCRHALRGETEPPGSEKGEPANGENPAEETGVFEYVEPQEE